MPAPTRSGADLLVLVLAAGEGKRMKSSLPKVLHPLAGRPLLSWVMEAAAAASSGAPKVAVLGRGHDLVRPLLEKNGWQWVLQAERLGTGHAVVVAGSFLENHRGPVMVLSGDTPLLTAATLRALLRRHRKVGGPMTLLTAVLPDPQGYGRVMRDGRGRVLGIVEQKELDPERDTGEINAGVYVFDADFLRRELPRLKRHRAAGEYYLTDLAAAAARLGLHATGVALRDADEVLGVNSRLQLAQAAAVMRERVVLSLMKAGVTLVDPAAVWVEPGVRVGCDTVLYPGTILEGATRIGSGCRIGPFARLTDTVLGNGVEVRDHTVIESARIRAGASIGPFARLRPGTDVGERARVGNFVEIKKSRLGPGVKAGHLTYLGDAEVGRGANIGAGTVTCNYDGSNKHRTVIGPGAFIGSDTMLVAPVRVGKGAITGAGSTITRDVPDGGLGLGRSRQVNVEGFAAHRGGLGNTRRRDPGGRKKT